MEKMEKLELLVSAYKELTENQKRLISNQKEIIEKYKMMVDILEKENTKLKAHAILKEAGMV